MKVGVCSLAIGDKFKESIKWCKESLEKYCKMYEYTLITDESVYDGERSHHWYKIKLVQKYLKDFDYLVWLDADIMIMNYGRRLEEFIDLIQSDKFLLICQGGQFVSNSGVFIIKNCEESFRFLEEVWNTTSFEGIDRDFKFEINHEQSVIQLLLPKYNVQVIPHSFGNILNGCEPTRDYIIHWIPGDFNIHFCGNYDEELKEKQLKYCKKPIDDPQQGFELLKRYKLLIKSNQLNTVYEKDRHYFDALDFKLKRETLLILVMVGIGDALMVNGLVRHFAETYNIILGVACWNSKNVKYFFRDLHNIQYLETVEGSPKRAAEQLPEMAEKFKCKKLSLGYWRQIGTRPIDEVGNDPSDLSNWVRKIYEEDAKIPESIRYSKFYAQRDPEREETFYQRVIQYLGTTDYIVLSESHEKLDRLRIPEKCKVFCIDKGIEGIESDLVMDYCKVIEKSRAFHGLDCGWAWLIEMLDLRVPKRYMHQYPPCARFHFDLIDFPEDYFKSGKWTVFRESLSVPDTILVPMTKSELIDRISILEIKLERISDPSKRDHVIKELKALERITDDRNIKLKAVNTILWNVEDELRIKEKELNFDKEFTWLARLVYTWNDRRHELKKDSEQKQHIEYQKKKPDLLILAPLGFGDALVINGLIRDLAERYDIIFGIEEFYHKNIHYMFRDLPNIRYILSYDKDPKDPKNQLAEKGLEITCEKMYLGYTKQLRGDPSNTEVGYKGQERMDWARNMYRDANLDPDIMFEKFFVLRDRWREEELYRRVIEHLGTTEYIVIHDCFQRGPCDRKKIPENIVKTYLLGKGDSPIESECIFDYRLVIEKAQAYHGPDGGFSWLVEMCKINVPKKYLHMYDPLGRTDAENFPNGYYRSEWIVLR